MVQGWATSSTATWPPHKKICILGNSARGRDEIEGPHPWVLVQEKEGGGIDVVAYSDVSYSLTGVQLVLPYGYR